MRLQVLSHAALRVNVGDKELLCDPWIVGSCYWRSWWNYPPVPQQLRDSLKPDFVYLTHLHWDHFQGLSLRLFPRTTRIFVPYFRHNRMVRDLNGLGFKNVTEMVHGKRIELGERLAIRSYQVGPIFADSALVIEADNKIIFNANDAKFAGMPLGQILRHYPTVDFCLRSHSSANARRCMHVTDEADAVLDDDTNYLSSFSLFMKRVRPRFAIPFASNSCYLHKDVWGMNAFSQTPLMVKQYFDLFAAREKLETELRIMIPGDEWSDEHGFRLAKTDWFEAREQRLKEYAETMRPTLEKYYAKEDVVRVSPASIEKYLTNLWKKTPFFLKRRLRNESLLLVSLNSTIRDYFAVDLRSGAVKQISPDEAVNYQVRAEFPAIILAQSVRMNMFSQAWISKRVHYYSTRSKMFVLNGFLRILGFSEAELLPLRSVLSLRTARSFLPRWREIFLYAHAFWHLLRRRNLFEIEARLLER